MATNPKQGAGIEIKPFVNEAEATKAMARVTRLAEEANKAAEQGNIKRFASLNQRISAQLGKPYELKIQTKVVFDNATQSFKQIKTLGAGAMDPLLKASKQADKIQGQGIKKLRKLIELEKQKSDTIITTLKNQKLSTKERQKQNTELEKSLALQRQLANAKPVVTTRTSMQGQLREAAQLRDGINRIDVAVNKYGRRIYSLNPAWVAQNKKVQMLQRSIKIAEFQTASFGGKVAMAGAAMQAAFGPITAVIATLTALGGAVGAVTSRVKDIQSLKLTFDGLGQSVETQNAILDSSKRIALSYGVSLRKVEGAFRRLGPAILESGGSLKDTESAIESIAARTTMLGLNTEQSGRYIEAFAQVMGKGKLQSEELNQQFSELDGGLRGQLKNWLAANKGISDFEGAMKRGEITSGIFLEAFEAINVEIRNKFLRSIGDTQKAISNLGEEGGMTLNQLNATIGTLTSIGMEGLARAFSPLGKELMKIYAAFVQVFTKIAAEMPGITSLFRGFGHVIGVVVKVAINSVILVIGLLAQALSFVIELVVKLYNWLKKLPVIGDLLKGLEDIGVGLNNNFDNMVDSFSRLSDETTGATTELDKYKSKTEELNRLKEQERITEEEYQRRKAKIEEEFHNKQIARKKEQLNDEINNFKTAMATRKEQFEEEKTLIERKIEDIDRAKDTEVKAIDEVIQALEQQKKETKAVYDEKIRNIQRAYEAEQAAIARSQANLKAQENATKTFYDRASQAVADHYSKKRAEMEASHRREMAMMDASINALRTKQSLESKALEMGPEAEKLNLMRAADLKRQAARETDQMKKQELLAQAEAFESAVKQHEMEMRHINEQAIAEANRRRMERRHAEEKQKLMEEEKAAQAEIDKKRQAALDVIARSTQQLANQAKQSKEDEKKDINELKDKQRDLGDEVQTQLDKEKQKRREVVDDAKAKIDELKDKIQIQERAIEDLEFAFNKVEGAVGQVGDRVDAVTNGSLERMLSKIRLISSELSQLETRQAKAAKTAQETQAPAPKGEKKSGIFEPLFGKSWDIVDGKVTNVRAAGGPVTGGSNYIVNELGREGFLSSSGQLSEINAPAWGQWKAPSSGTVIPADVWKNIKAAQASNVSMPKTANPGNGVAQAIGTLSNRGGDQFNNSVTIQAANPVQAANNVMVEMTRLRRRRFR